jgi:hypothetical protein
MMQVVWNRETKAHKQQYMKNVYSNSTSDGDVYYKYIKEVSKEDDDDKFVGIMFFIGGIGVGSAPHILDTCNLCVMFVEPNPAKPKVVKCIQGILRVNLAEKGGLLVEPGNFEPVTMKIHLNGLFLVWMLQMHLVS